MAVLPDGVQRIELALQSISARRPDLECFLVSVKKDATEKLHKRFESAVRNLVRSVIFRKDSETIDPAETQCAGMPTIRPVAGVGR